MVYPVDLWHWTRLLPRAGLLCRTLLVLVLHADAALLEAKLSSRFVVVDRLELNDLPLDPIRFVVSAWALWIAVPCLAVDVVGKLLWWFWLLLLFELLLEVERCLALLRSRLMLGLYGRVGSTSRLSIVPFALVAGFDEWFVVVSLLDGVAPGNSRCF